MKLNSRTKQQYITAPIFLARSCYAPLIAALLLGASSSQATASCTPNNTGNGGSDTITRDADNNPNGADVDGGAGSDTIDLLSGDAGAESGEAGYSGRMDLSTNGFRIGADCAVDRLGGADDVDAFLAAPLAI